MATVKKTSSARARKVKLEEEIPAVTPVADSAEFVAPKEENQMRDQASENSDLLAKSEDSMSQGSEPENQKSDSSSAPYEPRASTESSGESRYDRPRYSRPQNGNGYSRGYSSAGSGQDRYPSSRSTSSGPVNSGQGYDRGADRGYNRGYDDRSYGSSSRQFTRPAYNRSDSYNSEPEEEITVPVKGFLDIQHEGHGFLRPKFRASDKDIYISSSQIRRFWLRNGDLVEGTGRPPKDNERYFGLLKIEKVNDKTPEESLQRPSFDDLTAIYPDKQVVLNTGKEPLSTRIIDLVSPIGFGQRGMIVSPPKAGKTTIMKNIAEGISANHPDVHLMAILIGERPEEVTDISRSVKGEVVASNFDESPETQTRIAEIAMDRAKRLVEEGKQVVVLLDSITRLARAYNLAVDPSGRTLSGGFDPAALYPAKKFFGAARNCEEGGSLTIIGTALVDTGSRMDDLIFEEFKGTGNMEVHLDRRLADRRVFPAINVERSGTREEARILPEDVFKKVVLLRRMIDVLNPEERTEVLIERLQKTEDNVEFLQTLAVPKE